MNKRRLIRVPIHLDLWLDAVRQDSEHPAYKCVEGIPQDAEFISSGFDEQARVTYLIFRHDSFAEVEPSEQLPEFVPMLQYHDAFYSGGLFPYPHEN